MTIRASYLVAAAAACSLLVSAASAGPAMAEPPVSIVSYTLIESSVANGIDIRSYDLEVLNSGSEDLLSVRAILRKAPAFISALDAEVEFGPVAAGETVLGDDGFTIAVDTLQADLSTADIGFIWEVVTEDLSGWNEVPLFARLGVLEGY